jgi:alkyl hydroperoxide reductase subunit F
MFDLAILGGGPAGVSAGVYAARKKLKTVLITKDFGGQSIVSDGIENWIGDKNIPGPELAKKLEDHLRNYEDGIDIKTGEFVSKVSKIDGGFEVETDKEKYQAKTVLVATGSSRKKLQAKGADKYENKGIVYCASCDGPLFSVTVEAVKKDSKMTLIKNAETTEIFGETLVKGLKYEDKESGEEKTLNVEGVFVEIGSVPTTEFVKDIVPLDEFNRIKIDPWTQRSEIEGVWAAGDCSNIRYHQNNIAAGDAVRALEDIYLYIKKLEG